MNARKQDTPDEPLGLYSGTVRVVPYQAAWPERYAAEAARLNRVFDELGLSLILEHSGSTAVPGLDAKPVLDMIAGREPGSDRGQVITAIVSAGYSYRGEQDIPGRDFFRRGDPRQYHLHLAVTGSAFWNDHRAFRDHLRANPETAAAYAKLKRDLAELFRRDREAYINGKTAFIRGVLGRVRRDEAR